MISRFNRFIKGFYYAGQGIIMGFNGRNMQFHGIVAVITIIAGIIFRLSQIEWLLVLIAIGLVWASELVNSSIEKLSDVIRDSNHLGYQATKSVRDMAAGAVLVTALTALIIGVAIFCPKIFH